VRALGSAIREFHRLEPQREDRVMVKARAAVDDALVQALPGGDEPLLRLRAVQLEEFMGEVHAFERSGTQSRELVELAGNFVRAMQNEGYCHDHGLVTSDAALVAMFKQMWNAFLGFDARPAFELSLDERRALYALYLSHATPAPAARDGLESARRGAHDENACDEVVQAETAAIEARRLERIAKLATFDPEYPAAYARGVANLRRRKYAAAADALRTWLRDHPEGPLALRAQTFLREALRGARGE
jgi:TolA-binding protein